MGQGAMGLGMLGRRQVMLRWAKDPVWMHNGSKWDIGQRWMQALPHTEIRRRPEKGGAG